MTTYATPSSPVAAAERTIVDSVTSKDGTIIGYRQIGQGAGVVLVHGAMETSQSHMELAEVLADKFTVYMPDRRGRGLSGAFGNDYSIQKEVEDLDALVSKTGAHYVFGVSAGGLISLQAALKLPVIHKLALFEPALVVNGSISTDFLERYDREIAQGKIAAALVTGMKSAQMGPPIFNYIPRWVLEQLTASMMDKKANDVMSR
jgi:pimeloyl-ACP methyl ester carboxylesterase